MTIRDSRETNRRAHRVEIRFWKEDEEEGPRTGFSKDLSTGGMFISTTAPFPPRTRIQVETVGTTKPIRREAEVVHFIAILRPAPGAIERKEAQFVATAAHVEEGRWAESVAPILHRLRPTGMGVRFLEPLDEVPTTSDADDSALPS